MTHPVISVNVRFSHSAGVYLGGGELRHPPAIQLTIMNSYLYSIGLTWNMAEKIELSTEHMA